jgi:hypothetical protein
MTNTDGTRTTTQPSFTLTTLFTIDTLKKKGKKKEERWKLGTKRIRNAERPDPHHACPTA